jgi:hypothetical protein
MQDLSFRHFISVSFTSVNSVGNLGFTTDFTGFTIGSLSVATNFTKFTSVGNLSVATNFTGFTIGDLILPVNFTDFTINTGVSRHFTAVVMLNGVDVSSSISGTITVEYSESESAIAQFVLKPSAGVIDPYSWIDNPITVDFIETDVTGAVTGIYRKFTGVVHLPDYDVTTRFTHFTCTDNLQESLELLTRLEIDTLIGGFNDLDVLGEADDNWTYAQNQLSTIPFSYDKDQLGEARKTAWQSKVTPDLTFTQSSIIDGSLDLSLAERRNITNKVNLTFEGRQERKWHRELSSTWQGFIVNSFVSWLQDPYPFPTRDRVRQSLEGWLIKSLSFVGLPPSGAYPVLGIGQDIVWELSDYAKTLATSATFTIAKRWLQTTTSKYILTVSSAASIAQHGELSTDVSTATNGTTDSEFEVFEEYSAPTGTALGNGDYVEDIVSDWTTPVETAIAQARVIILDSHRKNTVSFSSPMIPIIDTSNTVQVTTPFLTAKGKVSKITDTIDLEAGSAITTVTLSLYLPNVAGQVDSAITAPTNPTPIPTTSTPGELPLDTRVGNRVGVAADNEAWRGWVTNQQTLITLGFTTHPFYEERFVVELPEVAVQDRDEVIGNVSQTFSVAIPQDLLTIGA